MDLALAFFAGMLLAPWWVGLFFVLICIADAICLENDCEGWGTSFLIFGTMFLVWVGMGVNPFSWAWNNYAELLRFAAFYFAIGAVWSVVKWTIFLVNVKVAAGHKFADAVASWERFGKDRGDVRPRLVRPESSFATNNKARILSWIGHWPFSMLGTLCGDVLTKLVKTIYNLLSGLYDQIGRAIFRDFDAH